MRTKKEINNSSESNTNEERFVYCNLKKCPHKECLRHTVNTPFNTLIYMRTFNPDKEWNCKDILKE